MNRELYALVIFPDHPDLQVWAPTERGLYGRDPVEFKMVARSLPEFLVALEHFSWQLQLHVNKERAKLREQATSVPD